MPEEKAANSKNVGVLWLGFMFILLLSKPALANSSWRWLTRSPRQVLAVAVVLTLLVETWAITSYGKVTKKSKAFIVVALANMLSFVAPYVLRAFMFQPISGGFLDAWFDAFDAGPYYIIRLGYLILTLAVEVPIVRHVLKQYTDKPKNLLNSVIIANVVTTVMVAVMERILCRGQW